MQVVNIKLFTLLITLDMNLGNRFKEIRSKTKLNQTDFAERMGTSQSVLSRIEKGEIAPTLSIINNLHNEFAVNLNWLFDGKGKYKLIENPPEILHEEKEKMAEDPPDYIHLEKEIKYLKKLLEEKDKRLALYEVIGEKKLY